MKHARFVVAGLAVLLAVVVHHPLLAGLGSVLPGEPASDALRGLWSTWLIGEEVPGWPFGSDMVGFPRGVDIVAFPAVSLTLVFPTTRLFGPAVAMAVLVLFHCLFAFGATAWLTRVLGGGWGSATLAGSLVATQPVLGGALRDGTLEVLAVGWMPLAIGAMTLACRGSWRWGVATGVIFVLTCLESVYYGSFTAVCMLGVLTTTRTRKGMGAAAVSGVVVLVGVGLVCLAVWPVLSGISLDSAGDQGDLRLANAASLKNIKYLAMHPGGLSWSAGSIWGPPAPHLIALAAGGLLAIRRTPWLTVLGLFFFFLAQHHDWTLWWADGPIGQVVRFPRRYLAAAAVVLSVGLWWGSVPLRRWPAVELGIGVVLAGIMTYWGVVSSGYKHAYPTMDKPQFAFTTAIAEDRDDDAAVLFAPLEVPGGGGEDRSDLPVFASLSPDLASGDLLVLQVLVDKKAWTAPDLVTLVKRPGDAGLLAKNLSDLAFATMGQQVPGSARVGKSAYVNELPWLMGEGLKYVVVDKVRYTDEGLEQMDSIFEAAVDVTDYDDGTGVRVYTLWEGERPPPALEPPQYPGGDLHFTGKLVGTPSPDLAEFWILSSQTEQKCGVRPEGDFDCGSIDRVMDIWIIVDGERMTIEREGGYTDHVVRVVGSP
ncbi:MAG: hypothetical protein GY913_31190 [Proteobacteria bacterium]|nr:hypothetical protein [Pseudomonadota bacterium]MCP4921384.1 hypothetical protein [Pseudomonadota bacterium]